MKTKFHQMARSILLLFIFYFYVGIVVAQTGTDFWLTAPEVTENHGAMGGAIKHIVVSTLGNPATVTVSLPANSAFDPIVVDVPAFTTERIDLFEYNDLIETVNPDVVENKGILVQSTDNISAYLEVVEDNNPDIFALKGQHALGTEFYAPLQNKLNNQTYTTVARAAINIVATEDNTLVTIVPTTDISKADGTVYPAGSTITVTLNRGQTYSVRADSEDAVAHPSGTHIISNKPIAVSTKDDSVIAGGWDLIGDQIVPVDNIGSQYIVMKGQLEHPNETTYKEFAYVVITEANTEIFANGVSQGIFNPGDVVSVGLTATDDYMVIESDNFQKFYTFHVTGFAGEIAGALLPPTDQCSGNSRIAFSYSYGGAGQTVYINIMVQAGAEDGFLVDGAVATWLDPGQFVTTPDGIWAVARFGPLTAADISEGAHEFKNTKGLFHLGYINDTGPGTLYGYFSDFATQEIRAAFVNTNDVYATQCFGEDIRLRVDGGFSYSWIAQKVSDPSFDVVSYMNATNIYNPVLNSTLPIGDYKFTVTVGGACGEPPIVIDMDLTIIQGPSQQIVNITMCEDEIGSTCISGLDLSSYETDMTGNWPNTSIIKWEKDVYNEMLMFEDYESERHLSYGSGYVGSLTLNAVNPDNTGINSSPLTSKVTMRLSGTDTNFVVISPKSSYKFDMSTGDVFSMKVYNHVYNSWAMSDGPRGITLRLINATDSIEMKVWMSKFDKWEQLTFDFSSFNNDELFTEAKIIFDVHEVHEQDEFYIDEIQKSINHQVVIISDISNVTVCDGAKIYGLQENDIGCRMSSELIPTITTGNFPVNNLTDVLVCQTAIDPVSAEHINVNDDYADQLIGSTGLANGNTIIEWRHIYTDYSYLLDNFDDTGSISWNSGVTSEQSGTVTFDEATVNPNINVINGSSMVGMVPRKDANFLYLTADLLTPLDLSEGYIFSLKVAYNWGQDWQKDNAKTVTLELSGTGGTVTSPAMDVKSSTNTRYDWQEITFDLSAYSTYKNLDHIELTFNTGNWGGVDWYIDDFARKMTPFKDVISDVSDVTIKDGDEYFAIVEDPDGCKVEASISFKVSDCGPLVTEQNIELCEDTEGGGTVGGVDLTALNDAVMNSLPNTIEWFTDAARTVPVSDPINVTVSNGTVFYILVTDSGNGKTSETTAMYTVNSLPPITFPSIATICEGESDFQISGVTPTGGIFAGTGVNATGLFSPGTAGVGVHTITYDYIGANTCSNSVARTIDVKAEPNASLVSPQSQTYCGTTGVTLEVSNVTGATYNWTRNSSAITGNNIINNALAGTYEVLITKDICEQAISNIQVIANPLPTYSFSTHTPICEGNVLPVPTVSLTGTAPWNITYTINGTATTTSINASPYTIPFTATTPNTYTIALTAISDDNTCVGTITADNTIIEIIDRPDITFNTLSALCADASAIDLSTYVSPVGGTFTGNGVSGTTFTPAAGLVGTQTVTYEAINNGCNATADQTIEVYSLPVVAPAATPDLDVCINETVTLQGTPSGGSGVFTTHLWTGNITPLSATNVVSPDFTSNTPNAYTVNYEVTDDNGCTANADLTLVVRNEPSITITPFGPYCENNGSVDISTNASPVGGTWSGSGVSGTSFDPTGVVASSPVTLQYDYTDSYNCSNSEMITITVNPVPTIDFTIPAQICNYASPINLTATVSPTGGTGSWSGFGVSSNIFSPAGLSGTNTITYDYTVNGCSQTLSKNVEVNQPPVLTFTLPSQQCSYDASFTLNAAPAGGTYITTYPLTGDDFDPALAAFSQNYDITYEYQDPSTLCENTIQASTVVYHTNPPTTTNNGEVIQNVFVGSVPSLSAVGAAINWYYPNLGTQVATGTNTYIPDENLVVDIGGTDIGIVGTYIYLVTQTLNGCTSDPVTAILDLVDCPAPQPIVVNVDACIDDPDSEKTLTASATINPGDEYRWYTAPSIYTTGSAFIIPENTPGDYSYTVVVYDGTNNCEGPGQTGTLHIYTPPTVTISASATVCENGAQVSLSGNPLGGIFSGTGVSGDEFIPTGLTPQAYTIQYDVTYGNACTANTTKNITVFETPVISINSIGPFCENEASEQVTVTNLMSGGSGTWVAASGGLVGDRFTPQSVAPGDYDIQYNYTSDNGCIASDTYTITVLDKTDVTFDITNEYCIDVTSVVLSAFVSNAGGTFTGNGVTGNTFDPSSTGAGTELIEYIYTNIDGCSDTVNADITVNALPIITFTPQSDICIDDTPITLLVSADKSIASHTFSGTGVVPTDIFDPGVAPLQENTPYTIAVSVTDNDGCNNTASSIITVHYTEPPSVTDASEITQNVTSGNVPPLVSTGTAVEIFNDASATTNAGTGNSFTVPESLVIDATSGDGIAGVYTYYFTQTLHGCRSEATPGTLTLIDCPAPAPGLTNQEMCLGETIPSLNATAASIDVRWYDADKNGIYNGASYIPGLADVATVGVYTYYVSQYDIANNCESPKAKVTLTVHNIPNLSIDNLPSNFCIDDNVVSLEATPAGGTFDIGGSAETEVDPATLGAGTHTVTYNYTDVNNCSNVTTQNITVFYTEPPVVKDTTIILYKMHDYIYAQGDGLIKWYMPITIIQGIGKSILHNQNSEGSWTYFLTQTKNGCISDTVEKTLTIVDCGTPTPTVNTPTVEICEGGANPTFTFGNIASNVIAVAVYDNVAQLVKTIAAGDPYEFTPSETTPGTYTWTVIQDTGCVSPPASFTYIIHPNPAVGIHTQSDICVDADPIEIVTTPAGGTLSGTGISGSQFNPSVGDGQYTIGYTYTDTYNCTSQTSKIINVHYTPPPTANDASGLTVFPTPNLVANGQTIQWYSTSVLDDLLYSGNVWSTGIIGVTDTMFYVTQTQNNCESEPETVHLVLTNCPTPKPGVSGFTVCEYDEIPNLFATGDTIKWYTSVSETTPMLEGDTLYHTISTPGTYTYYVSQTNVCEGPKTKVTFAIVAKPDAGIDGSAETCKDGNSVELQLTPAGGILTGTGLAGNTFIPSGTAGEYEQTYTYTSPEGCSDTALHTIQVYETAPPVGENLTTFTYNLNPDMEALGTDVKWYTDAALKTIPVEGNVLQHGYTEDVITYYYVTQTENNCESKATKVRLQILSCGTPKPDVSDDASLCMYDEVPDLTASGLPGATFHWFKASDPATEIFEGEIFSPGITIAGEYEYMVMQDTGCRGEASYVTILLNEVEQPNIQDIKDFCEYEQTPVLKTFATGTIEWFTSTPQYPPQTNADYVGNTLVDIESTPGTYTYYAVQKTGECYSPADSFTYTVKSKPINPEIDDEESCEGLPVKRFEPNNSVTGSVSWFDPYGKKVKEGNSYLPALTLLKKNKLVEFTAFAFENSCTSDTVTFTYFYKAKPEEPVVDTPVICLGEIAGEIDAVGQGIVWYAEDAITILQEGNSFTPAISDTVGTYYYWLTQTVNSCTSSKKRIPFNVEEVPDLHINGQQNICEHSFQSLYMVDSLYPDETYIWSVSGERPFYTLGNESQTKYIFVDWKTSGIDTVRVIARNTAGCSNTAKLIVSVSQFPTAGFEWNLPGAGSLAKFTNTSEQPIIQTPDSTISLGFESRWYFKYPEIDTAFVQYWEQFDEVQQYSYEFGYYKIGLAITNEYGCSDSTVKEIFVDVTSALYVPNAFAPTNISPSVREFRPKGFNMETYECRIFDSWGNLVWYSNKLINGQPAEGWDGVYDGQLMKSDVYFWKIEATFQDGSAWEQDKKKMGTVLLIR